MNVNLIDIKNLFSAFRLIGMNALKLGINLIGFQTEKEMAA